MIFSARARALAVAFAVVAFASQAEAQTEANPAPAPHMSESAMTHAFGGKSIDGTYADGVAFTETYGADGRLDYRERGRDMTGRWLVRGGSFCTLYDTSPTGGCFRVVRKGANCFEFYFVARDDKQIERGQGQPPSWTAQAWIKGEFATCSEAPTA